MDVYAKLANPVVRSKLQSWERFKGSYSASVSGLLRLGR
jgi:hypothetical protein